MIYVKNLFWFNYNINLLYCSLNGKGDMSDGKLKHLLWNNLKYFLLCSLFVVYINEGGLVAK